MGFKHAVEHVITRIQKTDRRYQENRNEGIHPPPLTQQHVEQPTDGHRTKPPQDIHHVEGPQPTGQRTGQQHHAYTRSSQRPQPYTAVLGQIDPQQRRYRNQNETQHREFTDRSGILKHPNIAETDADNKIDHGTDSCKQHGSRHTLAIEHQRKGQINQSRTRLALPHDEQHRTENEEGNGQHAAPTMKHKTICPHELSQRQGRSKLGKLSGLNADRSQDEPRARALRVGRNKDGH